MSLDSDPEISAAFSSADTPSAANVSSDPEISEAFKDSPKKETRPRSPMETAFYNAPSAGTGDDTVVPNMRSRTVGGFVGLGENALSGVTGGAGSLADAVTGDAPGTHDWAYRPRTAEGKDLQRIVSKGASALGGAVNEDIIAPVTQAWGGDPEAMRQTLAERVPEALGATGTVLGGVGLVRGGIPRLAASGAPEKVTAQGVADQVAARQSGGAAGASPDVAGASKPLQDAIASADPTKVDQTAMNNHLEADKNGVQLMKGQANRDPIQFSEEQNQSTHPMIAKRLNDQNDQITSKLDDIRRDASPTNVANSARENGQVAVDDLKVYDEPIRADIKARYQKLEDANGGAIPIDTGATISNIDARLKKGSLTRTAGADPAISEVMDNLRSGQPIDFEQFESARSLLAGVQRKGGSAGVAAGIARDELEKMPLPPEAAPLKALADDARNAASSRFEAQRQDPAYEAAVDDVTNGVKRGKPSPLADTFLDDYALNRGAPKSQVDLMMSKLGDEGKGAVASHTLNAIRKGGISASGNVLPNGYNSAMAKYADKMPSLVTPEVNDSLQSLGRTITNAKVAPPGSSVAPKSGVIVRDAIQGAMEHAANAKTMGAYGVLKKVFTKDGFAKEATAPGAGIER